MCTPNSSFLSLSALTILLVSFTACGTVVLDENDQPVASINQQPGRHTAEPVSTSAHSEAGSAPPYEPLSPQNELTAFCPIKWTCDSHGYFASKKECIAACGDDLCYRDADCTRPSRCICP